MVKGTKAEKAARKARERRQKAHDQRLVDRAFIQGMALAIAEHLRGQNVPETLRAAGLDMGKLVAAGVDEYDLKPIRVVMEAES